MKTSNKLLILLALVIIIVPIISIAIYSRLNYVKIVGHERNHKTFESLDVPSLGYTSKKLDKNFNTINIKAENSVHLVLILVQSDQIGIKFSNRSENNFESTFDKNGELVIDLKKVQSFDNVFYIYAPKVKKITTENMAGIQISTKTDSLELVLKNSGRLNTNSTFEVQNLSISATSTEFNIMDNDEFNLNVNLQDARFLSYQTSYKKLNIISNGNSFVQIGNNDQKNEMVNIEEFNLNTFGSGSISLGNLNIKQLTGKLSDETTITAPFYLIKNLK
jgi:hypothetical protein